MTSICPKPIRAAVASWFSIYCKGMSYDLGSSRIFVFMMSSGMPSPSLVCAYREFRCCSLSIKVLIDAGAPEVPVSMNRSDIICFRNVLLDALERSTYRNSMRVQAW